MKKITMRLIALALLTIFSMGAAAKIDVQIAKGGKFDGGTIEVAGQEEQKEGGVKVTITVSPNSGYTIKKEAIKVYATYPLSGSRADTRDIEIASNLTLLYNGSEKEDVKDASAKRDYTFTVPSGFGAWIKEAKFLPDGSKGGSEPTRTDYSGMYYIKSVSTNKQTTGDYYLCPTEGWAFFVSDDTNPGTVQGDDNGKPFLTTYHCKNGDYDVTKAVWNIEKGPESEFYYIKQTKTGRYMVSNGPICSNANRARVHLEEINNPEDLDDKALFKIYLYNNEYLVIQPKGITTGSYKWLTVNQGNKDDLAGTDARTDGPSAFKNTGGIICIYSENDANAKWELENALSIDAPTITNNYNGTITITAASGATIYYTTDGSTPTMSSSVYSTAITLTNDITVVKAIAKVESDPFPTSVTTYDLPVCEKPVITQSGSIITITCTTEDAIIHYTTNGDPATSSSTIYTGPFDKGSASEIRAIATKAGYANSSEAAILPPTEVSSSDEMTDMSGNYILASNFTSASSIGTLENPFSGTIDGNMVTLSGLSHPLVAYANGATIKNVMLKDVQISGSGNVGAIAGVASGYTRIYNCGILPSSNKYESETSSVSSSDGYCGGLVGWLKDDSRVINCFSYANITGGTTVAGIVGYNDFASTTKVTDGKYSELKTAVVNCMFYGNITGGNNRYPVYGGAKMLNNTATGINNYDFYRAEANLGLVDNNHYNCSWPAKEEYLTKYEYYRYLLNSNRELCGWWVGAPAAPSSMSTTDVQAVEKDASLMAKWVLDPSIAPYPILKAPGKYYSAINQDPDNRINPVSKTWESRSTSSNTITTKAVPDTEGQKLGSITVTINKGGSLAGSDSKVIPITAMDIENNDFCYGKIQLPYYNSIFGDPNSSDWTTRYGGNYGDKVVVGWEITSVKGGTEGTLVKDWQTGYNFADRDCTNKDKERVFAQGGYYYVPNGVTEITITAKWADATYLDNSANNSYDRVYMSGANAGTDFAPAGHRPTTLGNGKPVQTGTIANNIPTGDVYEKAIVLVGNHQYRVGGADIGNANKGCTIISADFNLDDEPDYCLIWQLGQGTNRQGICPIRLDFLPVIEMGMAMKEDASTQYYSLGCYLPLGHFEVTETSLIHFGQFEFGKLNRTKDAPLILNGGIYDQYCKGTKAQTNAEDHIDYVILGGNVYMPSFSPGAHVNSGAKYPTRHCAVNVLGGRINNLYLTGNFNNGVTPNKDNPHCYIDGGNFKQIAAAAKEGIDGDVYFKINHSVIEEFYGGSTLADKLVTGNINVTVDNSKVTKYCGGPKFGNMTLDANNPANNKTVTTNATGTTFGVYYGGGNGGTSYVQYASTDITETNAQNPYDWNSGGKGNLNSYTPNTYRSTGKNYMADYEMEIVNSSTGTDAKKGIFRTYLYAAQFSATNTGPITNNLTDCKVLTSFYGGGNLGGVIGDVESTLTDTEVMGSAFGAGYSASVPEVTIYNKDKTAPTLNVYTGIITPTPDPDPNSTSTTYTWTNKTSLGGQTLSSSNPAVLNVDGVNYFYTEEPLENLGTVTGKVTLNIEGTTTVGESVYGGGEESGVNGNTEVTVNSGSIGAEGGSSYGYRYGNVYGGGKGKIDNAGNLVVSSVADLDAGLVKGNTSVTINGTTETTKIVHNVYGGGAVGSVGTFTRDAKGMPTDCVANTGQATVTINGGKIGHNRKDSGMVNGSSRGWEGNPNGEGAFAFLNQLAWVNNGTVIIGDATTNDEDKGPVILGSVYGGGENGHNFKDSNVTINKGTIGNADPSAANYDCGNVYGAGCGTDTYTDGEDPTEHHNPMAGIVRGTTTITVKGGHVLRNVYGGGSMGSVGNAEDPSADNGQTIVTISGGEIGTEGTEGESNDKTGHVFGGPKGNFNDIEVIASVKKTQVTINGTSHIRGSVFGGGENGIVKGAVAVNVAGGTIDNDVYGGGALAHTNTDNWDATANDNAGGWAEGKTSASNTTTVSLTGGTINGEAYGGALGQKAGANGESSDVEAFVYGDVKVELNKGIAITGVKGCVVNQIFGCNNLNGTPKGDVEVHVYNTQRAGATQIVNDANVTNAKVAGTQDSNGDFDLNSFDVAAVYGGGNQADYIPVDGTNQKTYVVIEGCDRTSIGNVYGGGNAAAVPGTHVLIKGSYEIGEVFGGGNGAKEGTHAHVGFYNESEENYALGDGKALVQLMAGKVKFVYGGSNTRGNIRGGATVNNVDNEWTEGTQADCCENMQVGQIFAGGKNADMASGADVILGCTNSNDWVEEIYAGARRANVGGDVSLTITSGKFGRVFGGNMISGMLNGSITVNIEENGVCGIPVIIGELYGGGNLAPYSIYGYNDDGTVKTSGDNPHASPVVNVRTFTSIGNIFGGGYGNSAVMVGSPTININEAAINHEDKTNEYQGNKFDGANLYFVNSVLDLSKTSDPTDMTNVYKVVVPDHTDGKMGAIGNIYGGGNAAEVQGDTHVNIGTDTEVYVVRPDLTVTDKVKGFYTRSWDSATKTYDYTLIVDADKTAEEGVNYYQKRDVAGADIRGNVYGGGNEAEVTGSTNVRIGKD